MNFIKYKNAAVTKPECPSRIKTYPPTMTRDDNNNCFVLRKKKMVKKQVRLIYLVKNTLLCI